MANASPEVVIPNVNYVDGGRQSFIEKISHVKYNGTISLDIEDFLAWSNFKEDDFSYKSSPIEFVFGQKIFKFRLQIVLNKHQDDHIGVFLMSGNPDKLNIIFDLMALSSSGDSFKKQQTTQELSSEFSWGFSKFLSKKDLKDAAENHLPNGTLKLKCDFTVYFAEISSVESDIKGSIEDSRFSANLSNLLTEGFLQDFVIRCDGKSIGCHKSVLASRSPYFKTMLTTDTIEKKNSEVELKDFSAEILRSFLKFLYTDRLDGDESYVSMDLLILADMCHVLDLKKRCEVELSKAVNKNNAIQMMSAGSLYSAEILMTTAARVVADNLEELIGSQDWKQMVTTNPTAMEALVKASI